MSHDLASFANCVKDIYLRSAAYLQHRIVKRGSVGQGGVPVDAVDGELRCHIRESLGKERVTPPGAHHPNPKQASLGWAGQRTQGGQEEQEEPHEAKRGRMQQRR